MNTETHASQHSPAPAVTASRPRNMRRLLVGLGIVVALVAIAVLRGQQKLAPDAMPSMAGMSEQAPAMPVGASSSAAFISSARQQLIGVRTATVAREPVEATTRAAGVVAYDETRTTHVHVKVAGWVERLFVDFVGQPIRRGQPLFSVYSPDLVTAQSDYLIALRTRRELAASSLPSAISASDALVNAARERLQRWDVTDAEIAALEASGKPSKVITLFAPFDGVVLERGAFAGQYVTPDMNSFTVADLTSVWVVGQAFELDAPRVRVGAPIEIDFPNDRATAPIYSKIDFVYPDIDPQTRRLRFRASLPNPERKLKPDTYVNVVVHGDAVDRLMVPREAVIDTGARKYVLLALDDGYFDPRDVEIGAPAGEFYPVTSGLKEGDRVVTSAQFLVDSETNLRSAMQNMSMSMPGMDMGTEKAMPAVSPTVSPTVKASALPSTSSTNVQSTRPRASGAMPEVNMRGMDMRGQDMPGMNMRGMDMPATPTTSAPSSPASAPQIHHHPGM